VSEGLGQVHDFPGHSPEAGEHVFTTSFWLEAAEALRLGGVGKVCRPLPCSFEVFDRRGLCVGAITRLNGDITV
jgi:hypothetical protein